VQTAGTFPHVTRVYMGDVQWFLPAIPLIEVPAGFPVLAVDWILVPLRVFHDCEDDDGTYSEDRDYDGDDDDDTDGIGPRAREVTVDRFTRLYHDFLVCEDDSER